MKCGGSTTCKKELFVVAFVLIVSARSFCLNKSPGNQGVKEESLLGRTSDSGQLLADSVSNWSIAPGFELTQKLTLSTFNNQRLLSSQVLPSINSLYPIKAFTRLLQFCWSLSLKTLNAFHLHNTTAHQLMAAKSLIVSSATVTKPIPLHQPSLSSETWLSSKLVSFVKSPDPANLSFTIPSYNSTDSPVNPSVVSSPANSPVVLMSVISPTLSVVTVPPTFSPVNTSIDASNFPMNDLSSPRSPTSLTFPQATYAEFSIMDPQTPSVTQVMVPTGGSFTSPPSKKVNNPFPDAPSPASARKYRGSDLQAVKVNHTANNPKFADFQSAPEEAPASDLLRFQSTPTASKILPPEWLFSNKSPISPHLGPAGSSLTPALALAPMLKPSSFPLSTPSLLAPSSILKKSLMSQPSFSLSSPSSSKDFPFLQRPASPDPGAPSISNAPSLFHSKPSGFRIENSSPAPSNAAASLSDPVNPGSTPSSYSQTAAEEPAAVGHPDSPHVQAPLTSNGSSFYHSTPPQVSIRNSSPTPLLESSSLPGPKTHNAFLEDNSPAVPVSQLPVPQNSIPAFQSPSSTNSSSFFHSMAPLEVALTSASPTPSSTPQFLPSPSDSPIFSTFSPSAPLKLTPQHSSLVPLQESSVPPSPSHFHPATSPEISVRSTSPTSLKTPSFLPSPTNTRGFSPTQPPTNTPDGRQRSQPGPSIDFPTPPYPSAAPGETHPQTAQQAPSPVSVMIPPSPLLSSTPEPYTQPLSPASLAMSSSPAISGADKHAPTLAQPPLFNLLPPPIPPTVPELVPVTPVPRAPTLAPLSQNLSPLTPIQGWPPAVQKSPASLPGSQMGSVDSPLNAPFLEAPSLDLNHDTNNMLVPASASHYSVPPTTAPSAAPEPTNPHIVFQPPSPLYVMSPRTLYSQPPAEMLKSPAVPAPLDARIYLSPPSPLLSSTPVPSARPFPPAFLTVPSSPAMSGADKYAPTSAQPPVLNLLPPPFKRTGTEPSLAPASFMPQPHVVPPMSHSSSSLPPILGSPPEVQNSLASVPGSPSGQVNSPHNAPIFEAPSSDLNPETANALVPASSSHPLVPPIRGHFNNELAPFLVDNVPSALPKATHPHIVVQAPSPLYVVSPSTLYTQPPASVLKSPAVPAPLEAHVQFSPLSPLLSSTLVPSAQPLPPAFSTMSSSPAISVADKHAPISAQPPLLNLLPPPSLRTVREPSLAPTNSLPLPPISPSLSPLPPILGWPPEAHNSPASVPGSPSGSVSSPHDAPIIRAPSPDLNHDTNNACIPTAAPPNSIPPTTGPSINQFAPFLLDHVPSAAPEPSRAHIFHQVPSPLYMASPNVIHSQPPVSLIKISAVPAPLVANVGLLPPSPLLSSASVPFTQPLPPASLALSSSPAVSEVDNDAPTSVQPPLLKILPPFIPHSNPEPYLVPANYVPHPRSLPPLSHNLGSSPPIQVRRPDVHNSPASVPVSQIAPINSPSKALILEAPTPDFNHGTNNVLVPASALHHSVPPTRYSNHEFTPASISHYSVSPTAGLHSPSPAYLGKAFLPGVPSPVHVATPIQGNPKSSIPSPEASGGDTVPALPPSLTIFFPPPPNSECHQICTDPYTPTPGSPCSCVMPMLVGIEVGTTLYSLFPLISELAQELAAGTLIAQSQVRIMGASTISDNLDRTEIQVDLVPLTQSFDTKTSSFIAQRLWSHQVYINETLFGNYSVLYIRYPGLPPAPPSQNSAIPGSENLNGGNQASYAQPLSVNVLKASSKLSGGKKAIISLFSMIAVIILVGVTWNVVLRISRHRRLSAVTRHTIRSSTTKRSGGGSVVSSTLGSLDTISFASSLTACSASSKVFTIVELERATKNFRPERVIGEGGFGRVYWGVLEDGTEVAVKVLTRGDQQGVREFAAEVEMLSRLHHRNLVKLLGICTEENVRCLVYELIRNGSVEFHLHGNHKRAPLSWEVRLKIALGSARALAYLHEDSNPRVIHRDFKSSNILLEDDFNPKVSDFGLAKAASEEMGGHISTRVMGTFGYVAPEYAMTGHLLVKSDVYSYGVVLLELLSGRKPVDMSRSPGEENLVTWARPLLRSKESLQKLVDPNLEKDYPFHNLVKVAAIASMCVHPEVSERPFMGEVVQALKSVYNDCEASDGALSQNGSVCGESPSKKSDSTCSLIQVLRSNPIYIQDDTSFNTVDYDSGSLSRSNEGFKTPISASKVLSNSGGFFSQLAASHNTNIGSGSFQTVKSGPAEYRTWYHQGGILSDHGLSAQLADGNYYIDMWP